MSLPEELPLDVISKYETRIPLALIRKDEKVYLERLTIEIEKEGITEPITIRVREDGSRIVWDGIHRLIVAQNLGMKSVPVKFIGEGGNPGPGPEVIVGFQVDVADVAKGYESSLVKVGDSVRLVGEPIDVGFPHEVLSTRIVPDIAEPQLLLTTKGGDRWVIGPFAELSKAVAKPPAVTKPPEAVPEVLTRLLAHLREAPQSKSTETYLRKSFGDKALEQAHDSGLVTRSPKGIYTILLKGQEVIKSVPRGKVNLYEEGKRILREGMTMTPPPPKTVPEAVPMTPVEYDLRYTLDELREMARQAGVSASGSKKEIAAQLIARGVK